MPIAELLTLLSCLRKTREGFDHCESAPFPGFENNPQLSATIPVIGDVGAGSVIVRDQDGLGGIPIEAAILGVVARLLTVQGLQGVLHQATLH